MMQYASFATRELALLLTIPVPILVYLFSLGRTPYRVVWGFYVLVVLAGQAMLVLGSPNIPPIAAYAIGFFFAAVLTGIPAICTEVTFHDNPRGEIRKWRSAHPVKMPTLFDRVSLRPDPDRKWHVAVRLPESRSAYDQVTERESVEVYIAKGDRTRHVGYGDPVTDFEGYAGLKVKAQDIADTYNREGI